MDACEQADNKFHQFLVNKSPNIILKEIAERYLVIVSTLSILYRTGANKSPQDILGEHKAIIDALVRHDGGLAERLARQHLLTVKFE